MGIDRSHGNISRPDLVDQLIDLMWPSVSDVVDRIEGEAFTTTQFIELLLTDPPARSAYDEAIERWGEGVEYARMVIHGQVIPAILRRSQRLEWAGYAHGEEDPYAVPAWWKVSDHLER